MDGRIGVFLSLLVYACAAPSNFVPVRTPDREIAVEAPVPEHRFGFKSEDGTDFSESGSRKLIGPGPEDVDTVSRGSYAEWAIDENAFLRTTAKPRLYQVFELLDDLRAAGLLFERGTEVFESGSQKQVESESMDVDTGSRGSYSFPTRDGVLTVRWVADENGFQATGVHLPTPPPIPEQRSKEADAI